MLKYSIEKDGITQGLLAMWMQCKRKARWFLQGYSSRYASMSLTYGTIGHAVLEKVYKDIQFGKIHENPHPRLIKTYVAQIENTWMKENPKADKQSLEYLELSCLIAEATLPIYFNYWKKDFKEMKWQSLEHEFNIPYRTKDGRKTILRGKMDGIFKNPTKLWLFESKFKSRIEEENLTDTLPFELQVMLYIWALAHVSKTLPSGLLYNVIRRVGLEQRKDETLPQFAERCIKDINSRPEFYFLRWEVSITKNDIDRFSLELEDMIVDFMNWWEGKAGHYPTSGSCGDKYGRCAYLNLCSNHGALSYIKRDRVFRELEDV